MGDLVFTGDIVIYLLSLAAMWGGVLVRIKSLEKKMDKHNCVVERLTELEVSFRDEKEDCQRRLNIIEKVLPHTAKGEN